MLLLLSVSFKKKTPIKTALLVLILSLCFCLNAVRDLSAQTQPVRFDPQIEEAFKDALRHYVGKNFQLAYRQFSPLVSSSLHHRMTATLLMTGKSLYKIGRHQESVSYFDRLIATFPQSRYVDDAFYARATAAYRLGRYFDATKDLLWIADFSEEPKLLTKSNVLALHIMAKELSARELQNLEQYARSESSSALHSIGFARYELKNGANTAAIAVLNRHKTRYGDGPFNAQIDQLLDDISRQGARPTKVGVILPLTGYFSEEGLGVLRGIKFAHGQSTQTGGQGIDLVIRDSESSMVKALQMTKELISVHGVQAIIGDLESQVTAGIGALAAERKVALVGPTATENGVAAVGSTVFQLNSDLERKGRALAEYAIKQLEMTTFATLAPADEYGQQMIASFSSTVDELGGRIIAQSWYNGTPEDLNRQLKNIRESAFHYDSTDVELMIQEAQENGEVLKERDIPVLSIDGFFAPIYSEDIQYVGPQLAQHNIRTQFLGGEYLDDLDILKKQQIQPYINGAIFVSDYFPDEQNRQFRTFRSDFRMRMKRTPERWEVFGYDAFEIIDEAIRNGARGGHEIARYLEEMSDYSGKKGVISFKNNNRVNSAVNFLQFINGRIVKHVVVPKEN